VEALCDPSPGSRGVDELGFQFAHADAVDRGIAIVGANDIGDMAEQLPDDVDRLQCNAMFGDNLIVHRQLVAHRHQHIAGVIELRSKAMIEFGRDAGHVPDLKAVSLRRHEQQLGDPLRDRGAVEAVGSVKLSKRSSLAEPLDPERCDSLADHAAKP